jgi:hypothetical protein
MATSGFVGRERELRALESLLDETFVRTFRDGSRQTRREALEELGSGRLKFTRLETSGVTVDVYGDAAVVRGKSLRQRSAVPGAGADAAPFEVPGGRVMDRMVVPPTLKRREHH